MTQFAFGSGTLIGKRTDVTGTPPCLLGTLQDVSLMARLPLPQLSAEGAFGLHAYVSLSPRAARLRSLGELRRVMRPPKRRGAKAEERVG